MIGSLNKKKSRENLNVGKNVAQSTGAVQYTDCISAEEYNSSNKRPIYDTKQSDDAAPGMLELWGLRSNPFVPSLLDPL